MNNMWDTSVGCIRKVATEVLRISRGIIGGLEEISDGREKFKAK